MTVDTAAGPLLILFGLDYTIWPFYVGSEAKGPFTKDSEGKILDSTGKVIEAYKDVPTIFQRMHEQGVKIAVGTINTEPDMAEEILKLLDLDQYISYKELKWMTYNEILRKVHEASGIQKKDMIFFDDSQYNTRILSEMGVYCVFVDNGMTLNLLEKGIRDYHDYRKRVAEFGDEAQYE